MTINVNNGATINEVLGYRTDPRCKLVINKTSGLVYASTLDAADALGCTNSMISAACRGLIRTCKGNRLEYVDKTSGNVDSLTSEIRRLLAENERLNADAAIGRAIREEREVKQKQVDNARLVLEKANAKFERCKATVERKEAEYYAAIDRYSAAEKEMHEAELRLLTAEGKAKT